MEHPAVVSRGADECEHIRAEYSIQVVFDGGETVPKPLIAYEETPFPDWATEQLKQSGFLRPTGIQVQAWPIALKGFDLVGITEGGTCKTLTYILPLFVHSLAQPELRPGDGPVSIILLPTAEQCIKVKKQVDCFADATGIVCEAWYDDEPPQDMDDQDSAKIDVVVATPGSLVTMLNLQVTNLLRATYIVIDEADMHLQNDAFPQIRLLLGAVRPDRQVLFFSATWPSEVEALAHEVCVVRPIHIHVGLLGMSGCGSIEQRFVHCEVSAKLEQLLQALMDIKTNIMQGSKVLIYCNELDTVKRIVNRMQALGYPIEGFHSEQGDAVRDENLTRFKTHRDLSILACVQILGGANEFQEVRYVINYDMPRSIVDYIHRISRSEQALTLLTDLDLYLARELSQLLRASGRFVPDWIGQAARNRKKWLEFKRLQFLQAKRAAKSKLPSGEQIPAKIGRLPLEDADGFLPWRGRGRDRREKHLQKSVLGRAEFKRHSEKNGIKVKTKDEKELEQVEEEEPVPQTPWTGAQWRDGDNRPRKELKEVHPDGKKSLKDKEPARPKGLGFRGMGRDGVEEVMGLAGDRN
eukprot:gnl/MRDRNA2_/MRDRNA2_151504_c0_seq1.p1 gnl/MRDRNA2_/MRDRNA2_151504_c0~~gnl/MRDRNA2_/MRDRNA2_151504_c0_seq1.p1  ORF type:complete len:608 (-),score=123.58 gnl/MRDRNA2_/MRDRNA2_151504_c0_seq1:25-1767(-)